MNAEQWPPCGGLIQAIVAANGAARQELATKADIAELKVDFAALEAKLAAAIDRMLLDQLAVAWLLFAALKLS